jgi:hypothetical protein
MFEESDPGFLKASGHGNPGFCLKGNENSKI